MVINVQIKREANIRRCSLSLPFLSPPYYPRHKKTYKMADFHVYSLFWHVKNRFGNNFARLWT